MAKWRAVPPLPRDPFELVVPQWQELQSGLLIPNSVADRIQVERDQPDLLPPELREDLQRVAVVDEMPLSSDQLAGALNEEELAASIASSGADVHDVERLLKA